MKSPQFKGEHVAIFNRKISFFEYRNADKLSLLGLYVSQAMLAAGIMLILLNNLNMVATGTYFGVYSWVSEVVFSIGIAINFFSIPYLYFSSFKNFKKENDFWDKETFWILPLFFFGTFFLYSSGMPGAVHLLTISIIAIGIVHLNFSILSWKLVNYHDLASHHEYFMTLKYLTAYYVILLGLLVSYNPLQHVMLWVRQS